VYINSDGNYFLILQKITIAPSHHNNVNKPNLYSGRSIQHVFRFNSLKSDHKYDQSL